MTAADYKTCSTNLLKMDSVVPNGCSREQPAEVSDLPTDLCRQAAVFTKLFDKKEARLRDLLSDIQEIGVHVKKWNTKSKRSCYTGLVSAAVAAGAGAAIPFAGGVGFAITAALTSAAAGGALFGFKIKQFRTEEESLKKIKQFLKIVNRLEHELEEVTKLCENLPKAETPNVTSLKKNLVKLFQSMEKLRTADGVKELTGQCQTVFDEFEMMRKQLEEFRGSTEAETQTHNDSESAACAEKENSAVDSANEKSLTELENGSELISLIPQKDPVGKKTED
ncbi:uncharacterized protein LOC113158816 isoform X1 [Anabas testudineus]|uniref:uncharacterized protein LOC113158816 isoform X1 n=1 Tax=Anabas testudineus TaxID=64144 RepID=UPI000E460132|nr:uncharacterized protein LOC113158816 isoform X1 [Anabas testudineus]